MRGEAFEEVAQVGEGFDLIGFATGDEAEEDRGAAAAGFAGDEQPILSAQGHDFRRPLGEIVVDRKNRRPPCNAPERPIG